MRFDNTVPCSRGFGKNGICRTEYPLEAILTRQEVATGHEGTSLVSRMQQAHCKRHLDRTDPRQAGIAIGEAAVRAKR